MFMPNLGSFFTPRIRIHGLKISRTLPDPDPKHWLTTYATLDYLIPGFGGVDDAAELVDRVPIQQHLHVNWTGQNWTNLTVQMSCTWRSIQSVSIQIKDSYGNRRVFDAAEFVYFVKILQYLHVHWTDCRQCSFSTVKMSRPGQQQRHMNKQ